MPASIRSAIPRWALERLSIPPERSTIVFRWKKQKPPSGSTASAMIVAAQKARILANRRSRRAFCNHRPGMKPMPRIVPRRRLRGRIRVKVFA